MCSSIQTSHHPGGSNYASFPHYSHVHSLTFWLYIFIRMFLASAHFFFWRHTYEICIPYYWKYKITFRFIIICLRPDNDIATARLPVHYFFKFGAWLVSFRVNKCIASSTKLNYLQTHLPKSLVRKPDLCNSHIYQHQQLTWQHLMKLWRPCSNANAEFLHSNSNLVLHRHKVLPVSRLALEGLVMIFQNKPVESLPKLKHFSQ